MKRLITEKQKLKLGASLSSTFLGAVGKRKKHILLFVN